MLGWLAAAAAPLLIHLLSRRRYREVPWAAMQYLLAAVRKNSRRIRIENWLLLAVRTALVLLVVSGRGRADARAHRPGNAQPVSRRIRSWCWMPRTRWPISRTTVRRFDRAKQLAEQIVAESSQGDGFTLVLMADPPQVIVGTPSFAPADFCQRARRRESHRRRRRPGRHACAGRTDSASCPSRISAFGARASFFPDRSGSHQLGPRPERRGGRRVSRAQPSGWENRPR